jgi:hypothetical protein
MPSSWQIELQESLAGHLYQEVPLWVYVLQPRLLIQYCRQW